MRLPTTKFTATKCVALTLLFLTGCKATDADGTTTLSLGWFRRPDDGTTLSEKTEGRETVGTANTNPTVHAQQSPASVREYIDLPTDAGRCAAINNIQSPYTRQRRCSNEPKCVFLGFHKRGCVPADPVPTDALPGKDMFIGTQEQIAGQTLIATKEEHTAPEASRPTMSGEPQIFSQVANESTTLDLEAPPPQGPMEQTLDLDNVDSYWRKSIHRGAEPEPEGDTKNFMGLMGIGIQTHEPPRGRTAPKDLSRDIVQREDTFEILLSHVPNVQSPPTAALNRLGNLSLRFEQEEAANTVLGGFSCSNRRVFQKAVSKARLAAKEARRKFREFRNVRQSGQKGWKNLKATANSLTTEYQELKKFFDLC